MALPLSGSTASSSWWQPQESVGGGVVGKVFMDQAWKWVTSLHMSLMRAYVWFGPCDWGELGPWSRRAVAPGGASAPAEGPRVRAPSCVVQQPTFCLLFK